MNHKPENQKGGQMKDSFTERSKKLSEELERHLLADKNILVILDIMDRLNLSDCWLCAGTIRNFIWNQYSFDGLIQSPSLGNDELLMLWGLLRDYRKKLINDRLENMKN